MRGAQALDQLRVAHGLQRERFAAGEMALNPCAAFRRFADDDVAHFARFDFVQKVGIGEARGGGRIVRR